MDLKIEKLNKYHNKKKFECGYEMLDNYIQRQAKQDSKRDLAICYVLSNENNNDVAGYYTLSANSISRDVFPENIVKKLPQSYSNLPTILLGRLAVDIKFKGNGYGEYLLMDAFNECLQISEALGALAIIVDPIDDIAKSFYIKYGFILLPGTNKMLMPIKTIK